MISSTSLQFGVVLLLLRSTSVWAQNVPEVYSAIEEEEGIASIMRDLQADFGKGAATTESTVLSNEAVNAETRDSETAQRNATRPKYPNKKKFRAERVKRLEMPKPPEVSEAAAPVLEAPRILPPKILDAAQDDHEVSEDSEESSELKV